MNSSRRAGSRVEVEMRRGKDVARPAVASSRLLGDAVRDVPIWRSQDAVICLNECERRRGHGAVCKRFCSPAVQPLPRPCRRGTNSVPNDVMCGYLTVTCSRADSLPKNSTLPSRRHRRSKCLVVDDGLETTLQTLGSIQSDNKALRHPRNGTPASESSQCLA